MSRRISVVFSAIVFVNMLCPQVGSHDSFRQKAYYVACEATGFAGWLIGRDSD